MQQIWAITWMNIRNVRQRMAASLVSLIGIGGVVLVFVAVLAIGEGFRAALQSAGTDDVAMVLRGGSNSEMASALSQDAVNIVANSEGVARDADGPIASAELFVTVDLAKRSTGTWANVPLRGIESHGPKIHPHFHLTAGRMFTPGRNEIIVGAGAAQSFAGLDLGATVQSGVNRWKVVGLFTDNGGIAESEIWTDVRGLQNAYNRGASYQTVRVQLQSASAFDAFRDRLTTDPRLNVLVQTERQFYAEQSRTLTGVIQTAGVTIAVLMGIGAVFGALNTMYSAIAARAREIATLRALGFGSISIVVSVLTEAMLIGLIGGLCGGALAYVAFDGYRASTLNFESFSQVTFAFAVTPALLASGIGYALAIGLVGGFMPALRAAREPIVTGLRAT